MRRLNTQIPPLKTHRLLLRPYQEEDLTDLFTFCCHPQVGPAAGWIPHESISKSKQVLISFISQGEVWAVEEIKSKQVVGSIGLHQDKARAVGKEFVLSMGYVLSPAVWGMGYATEGARRVLRYIFSEMENPPELVSVTHYDFNDRSRRVIEKCGFKFEGVIRKAAIVPEHGLCDSWKYSMTQREWHQTVVQEGTFLKD